MRPSKQLLEFFNKYKDKAGIKVEDQSTFLEALEDVEKLESYFEGKEQYENEKL